MIISDVSLFEDIGGGSTRCMLAEDWSRGDMITEIIWKAVLPWNEFFNKNQIEDRNNFNIL